MLVIFNTQKELKQVTKRHINVTATLAAVLTPGLPAVYLYQGNLIRTATVEAILEAAPNHVRFETRNSIYTLSFYHDPDTDAKLIAELSAGLGEAMVGINEQEIALLMAERGK